MLNWIVGLSLLGLLFGLPLSLSIYGLVRRRSGLLVLTTFWFGLLMVMLEFTMPGAWTQGLAHGCPFTGVDREVYIQGLQTARDVSLYIFLSIFAVSVALMFLLVWGLTCHPSKPHRIRLFVQTLVLLLLLRAALQAPIAALLVGVPLLDVVSGTYLQNGLVDGLRYVPTFYIVPLSVLIVLVTWRGFPADSPPPVSSSRGVQDQMNVPEKSEVCAD